MQSLPVMPLDLYDKFLICMSLTALVVFIALFFIKAGYGKFTTKSWGFTVPNRIGWMLMECPVFIIMLIHWYLSEKKCSIPHVIFLIFFEIHYFQRSFVFPFLVKGNGRMPVVIMLMAVFFNFCNGLMQGQWIFYISPDGYYDNWLCSPKFIIGTIIFFTGMIINIHSDSVIRNLRKPGDNKHYLPHGGLYKFVTSANYFGEIIEWCGFAILTWSKAGLVFVWWTIANLVPRAFSIYSLYLKEFGPVVLKKKRIIPFIL